MLPKHRRIALATALAGLLTLPALAQIAPMPASGEAPTLSAQRPAEAGQRKQWRQERMQKHHAQRMAELKENFPEGVDYSIVYDPTVFVRGSIEAVVHTLIEAIVLVFFVLLIFLQNLRATFIPMIAVPVVLLGTFGILAITGYSINTLTMFAMTKVETYAICASFD